MKRVEVYVLYLLLVSMIITYGFSEIVFTSPIKMARLLETERLMIEKLGNYIQQREEMLNLIKRYIDTLKEPVLNAEEEKKFLSNPLQTFSLVSRVKDTWRKTEKLMVENSYEDLIYSLEGDISVVLPSENDFLGVINSLAIMQETYDLPIDLLLQGYIKDFKARNGLSVNDCIIIAHHNYETHQYIRAIKWLKECLKMYENENHSDVNLEKQIMELLYKSYLISHEFPEALIYIDKVINLAPRDQEARKNKSFIKNSLNPTTVKDEKSEISRLCRQMDSTTITVASARKKLKCRYNRWNSPFLRIAPLKEEELLSKPKILLYHQVVRELEAECIVDLSLSKFNNGAAKTNDKMESSISSHKHSSFSDGNNEQLKKLTERSFDMTGLIDAALARNTHVQYYGLGEKFNPSIDFYQRVPPFSGKFGKVIANVLFFLNDDYEGGGIVFHSLNLTVPVQRYGAVVWYTEMDGVNYENSLKYSGCPVYSGFAWIGKKTFRQLGTEFVKKK